MSEKASLRAQQLEVPADLTAAIAAVRNNASPEDWCLATYADSRRPAVGRASCAWLLARRHGSRGTTCK